MNINNNVYSKVSEGITHIAVGTNYIGKVESYNNIFTRLFAWVFCLSLTVDFDGKERSINKNSYAKLIKQIRPSDENIDISKFKNFKSVIEGCNINRQLKMRDVISAKDAEILFQKLALAISKGETSKALGYISKGANLEKSYFDRENRSPSFSQVSFGLDPNSACSFQVFEATPLLQAARKGHDTVVKYLIEAGANTDCIGKQFKFKRKILGCQINRSVEYNPNSSSFYTKEKVVVKSESKILNDKKFVFNSQTGKLQEENC